MLKSLDFNAFRDTMFRLRDPEATEIIAQEGLIRCTQVGTLGRVHRSGSAPPTDPDLGRKPDIPIAIYCDRGS